MKKETQALQSKKDVATLVPLKKKIWEWLNCDAILEEYQGNELIYTKLQSGFSLIDEQQDEYGMQIKVNLSQQFQYCKNLGWNWHKSWNLPRVEVCLDMGKQLQQQNSIQKSSDNNECNQSLNQSDHHTELEIEDAYVSIFSVSPDIQTGHLQDQGLKGETTKTLINNRAIFQSLKFPKTSYKNYIHYYDQLSNRRTAVKSVISPPIYVDSRKAARFTAKNKENKILSQVEPFHKYFFTKAIYKKFQKTKKSQSQMTLINNNLEGFIDYCQAQNIRNKIRHPYLIAVRFSEVFDLYISHQFLTKKTIAVKEKLLEIQKKLNNYYQNKGNSTSDQQPIIFLVVKNSNNNISENEEFLKAIQSIQNQVCITINASEFQLYLKDINSIEKIESQVLEAAYSEAFDEDIIEFPEEKEFRKNYSEDEEDNSSQDCSERSQDEIKSRRKKVCSSNKPPSSYQEEDYIKEVEVKNEYIHFNCKMEQKEHLQQEEQIINQSEQEENISPQQQQYQQVQNQEQQELPDKSNLLDILKSVQQGEQLNRFQRTQLNNYSNLYEAMAGPSSNQTNFLSSPDFMINYVFLKEISG